MENTSNIALSRQAALWRQMETVANNLANMNTPGYRGQELMFTSYLVRSPSEDTMFREQINFTRDFGVVHDTTPGPVSATGNSMDLALEGEGFFVVETPAGERYTRAGRFVLNEDGMLVNSAGLPVLGENDTPFFIAPNEGRFDVSRDGVISTENGPIGKLKIVRFEQEGRLMRAAGGLFEARPGQEPDLIETPMIAQGMLEGSNVNGVVEMTRMIQVQRDYGHAQNMIEGEHERTRKAMETWARRTV